MAIGLKYRVAPNQVSRLDEQKNDILIAEFRVSRPIQNDST